MMGHVLLEYLLSTCQVNWLGALLAACNSQQLVINSVSLPTVLAHRVIHDYEWAGLLFASRKVYIFFDVGASCSLSACYASAKKQLLAAVQHAILR
jgi:hypothetical protein